MAAAVFGCVNAADGRMPAAKLPGVPMEETAEYDPVGSDVTFIMNVQETDYFGSNQCDGYKMHVRVSDDGMTYWFRDFAPGYGGDGEKVRHTWVKGTLDGDEISVKAGQLIYDMPDQDQVLYLEAVTVNHNGEVDEFLNEFRLVKEGETNRQKDNGTYLAVYEDGETVEDAGFYLFLNQYNLGPSPETYDCPPPAEAAVESWVMTFDGGGKQISIARDGQNVYASGLAGMAPTDWIKGIDSEGVLTFPSGVLLDGNDRWFVRLEGGLVTGRDVWGDPEIEMRDEITFRRDEAADSYVITPSDACILESNCSGTRYFSCISDVRLKPYAGDVPAVPADPVIAEYDTGNKMLMVNIPIEDINGNYINPEKLEYAIYLNGKPYTFKASQYSGLGEDMTFIPYYFTDNWDFYCNGTLHTVFFHGFMNTIGMKVISRYEVDGVVNYSPNCPDSAVEITDAEGMPVSVNYYDMLGREVACPDAHGLKIEVTKHSDGKYSVRKKF